MGEEIGNEKQILPFIDAANIACGYHAGSEDSIRTTVQLCIEHNVLIGAHPSFNDRENFGRKEMDLPLPQVYQLVRVQLHLIEKLILEVGGRMNHVKPHGALYNMSARNKELAHTIARAVKDHCPDLIIFGLRGSYSISAAAELGLKTAAEIFADRTYRADGGLTPRNEPGALIIDPEQMISQLLQMKEQPDTDTVCIHSDGAHAIEFAQLIHQTLHQTH